MEDKILYKEKKVKLLNALNIFLASVLSIIGTVSIVSLLMFFNQTFGLSYFYCFVLTCILPSLYSLGANAILKQIDDKIKMEKLEIETLEKEENHIEVSKEEMIQKIELRFEGLSRESKMKLLNYVKEKYPFSNLCEQLQALEDDDVLTLLDGFDSECCLEKEQTYSRRRNKNE